MKQRLFSLLFVLLFTLPAAAQITTATLGGRITDENGPIEGVTVVLINQTTNAQYYATTGRGGWYHLQDIVPGGPFTVRIHYFGYDPQTVRGLWLYPGQNQVVDADLEAGETHVRCDEATTAMRLGEVLGQPAEGGDVAFSPLSCVLLEQRVYFEVPFDVRQESTYDKTEMTELVATGSSTFHASAMGLYGTDGFIGNASVSTPVGGEDYQLFAGLQYGTSFGFEGAGRFDARFNESNRMDLSGGHHEGKSWANGGLTSAVGGAASNRLQASWYREGQEHDIRFSDDFSYAAGAQQLLFGVRAGRWSDSMLDTAAMSIDFYAQDVIRFGRRLTVQAGVRFRFPFAFSPRASLYYDILGNGKVVLRAGTAVYGRPGGSTWKNLGAVDVALPLEFTFSAEAAYSQLIKQLFYIKEGNVAASEYAFTAKLERPLLHNAWASVCYTRSNGSFTDRLIGGFYYKKAYGGGRFATTAALLYEGGSRIENESQASISWVNTLQGRLSQDFVFNAGGRSHTLQLTAFVERQAGVTEFLAGLRYLL